MLSSVEKNCLPLQAMGHSMRSLLGPSTSVKCYVDERSHNNSAGLVLEPLQIVNALTTVSHGHPTNQLLYECCQGQQRECGCGVTTLVCMCGLWSAGVIKLVHQGVPLPVVFALLDQGLEVLQPLFTSHSVSIATMSHDKQLYKLKTFSRHFSSADHFLATTDIPAILSKGLAHGRPEAMSLAVETLRMRGVKRREGSVLTHVVVGPGQSSSYVLHGVVVNVQSEMISLFSTSNSQLRVAVLEGDCTLTSTHPGFSVTRSHDLRFKERIESDWLKQCAAVINKFNIGLVVVGGVMSPLLWEQCLATEVLVLTGVGRRHREAIIALSGSTSSYYLTHLTQAHTGTVGVKLVEGGWTIPTFSNDQTNQKLPIKMYSCCIHGNDAAVVTAMLCGCSESTVDLLSQQFYNCLNRLESVVADGYVLPGGGVFESVCAAKLREGVNKTTLPNVRGWMYVDSVISEWRPQVWSVLAEGLEAYSDIVMKSVNGVKSVWDDRVSKKRAWSQAISLLRTVCHTETIR